MELGRQKVNKSEKIYKDAAEMLRFAVRSVAQQLPFCQNVSFSLQCCCACNFMLMCRTELIPCVGGLNEYMRYKLVSSHPQIKCVLYLETLCMMYSYT